MKVIACSKLPRRDYCRAAEYRQDLALVAAMLRTQAEHGTFDDELIPSLTYRDIGLALSTGRFATLTQTQMRPSVIEIGLELHDGEFFHEDDLAEIVRSLGFDAEAVTRIRGGFTWIAPVSNA